MASKFTLGLYKPEEKIFNIRDVNEKQRLDFICLICDNPLTCVIKRGKVTPHFKHRNQDKKCNPALETLLHKAAKKIICETNNILLPDHRQIFAYNEAKDEVSWNKYRPDLTLTTNDKPIYVEIIVSNPISTDKELTYFQHRVDCLVIDLSDYPRLFEMETLERDVLWEPERRYLLYQQDNLPARTNEQGTPDSLILKIIVAVAAGIGYLFYKKHVKNKKVV